MSWKINLTEQLAEVMRFCVRSILFFNIIVLACGSAYFTTKFVWFALRYLDRTLFSQPW